MSRTLSEPSKYIVILGYCPGVGVEYSGYVRLEGGGAY